MAETQEKEEAEASQKRIKSRGAAHDKSKH